MDRGYNQPKLGGLTWFNQSTIGGYIGVETNHSRDIIQEKRDMK